MKSLDPSTGVGGVSLTPFILTPTQDVYPQLTQKAVVDFVNGLEVLDDHIRYRRNTDSGLVSRLWGGVTGETGRRQAAIDENVTVALHGVKSWLLRHEARLAESDLMLQSLGNSLGAVAQKLMETREGVMQLQGRVQEGLARLGQDLARVAEQAGVRLGALESRMMRQEAFSAATTQMENVLTKWECGQWAAHTPEQRLFLACNELHWGSFGSWMRTTASDRQHREMAAQWLQTFRMRAVMQLGRETARREYTPLTRVQIAQKLKGPDALRREVLHYLGSGYESDYSPLPAWLGTLNDDRQRAEEPARLDYLYSNKGLVYDMTEQAIGRSLA